MSKTLRTAGSASATSPSYTQWVYSGAELPVLAFACTAPTFIHYVTVASIIESRGIYIKAFNKCAAKIDAIRDHDAQARASTHQD